MIDKQYLKRYKETPNFCKYEVSIQVAQAGQKTDSQDMRRTLKREASKNKLIKYISYK